MENYFINNEDDKLKNLLKLKEKLEKDLVKKGIIKEKELKNQRRKSEINPKLKEKLTKEAHINSKDSLTIFDIVNQDYDSSIDSIIKSLRKFSTTESSANRKVIYTALIYMLEKKFKNVTKILENEENIVAKYNYMLSKIYSKEGIFNEIIEFLKKYPYSKYPYLLLLEYYLTQGNLKNISKILQALSKLDSFFKIIENVYNNKSVENSLIKESITKKQFPSLLMYILKQSNNEIENTKNYCLNVNYSYLEGTAVKPIQYCVKGQFALNAWKLMHNNKIDLDELKKFSNTPEYYLFHGFYYYNLENVSLAKAYFKNFEEQVEDFSIKIITKSDRFVGMKQFYQNSNEKGKIIKGKIFEIISNYPQHDFYVIYPNIEILRLLFAGKHCYLVYGG